MKLILISSPNKSKSEIKHIIDFFESGLDIFHIKKKGFDRKKMKEYIDMIPREFHDRLVLHSHYTLALKYDIRGIHTGTKRNKSFWKRIKFGITKLLKPKLKVSKSFHSIQSLTSDKGKYDFVLLSPVFDRHDMQDFSAAYSEKQLRSTLFKSKQRVVAFGGVKEGKVALARRTGFAGVAVHSEIWREKADRLGKFKSLVAEVQKVAETIN